MNRDRRLGFRWSIGFILAFLFLVSGEAFSATYYVSPTGSDSNSGSGTAPFRSIQKAADIVNPGDTVIVKDGLYTDTNGDNYIVRLRRGGTSSAWVTFRSENKWGAVLDGGAETGYGWSIAGASYIRIEDFELRNVKNVGFHIPSSSAVSNVYYYRNKVHDVARRIILCDDPRVSIGHSGFYNPAGTSYMTYDSNIIYDIGRLPGGCSLQQDHGLDHGMYLHSKYTTIINNVFSGTSSGWAIQLDGRYITSDWKIINNTFYGKNPQKNGHIILWEEMSNITIANNISHSPKNYFLDGSWQTSKKKNINIRHNLVYNASLINVSGSEFKLLNNITGQDPKFVDLTNRNFRLQSGSPAIDKGEYIEGYEYDADSNPIIGAPDIGSYEYTPPADIDPPSIPADLSATAVSASQINLSWLASTDNVEVAGYKVYRNSSLTGTTTVTEYFDAGLTDSTSYTYAVSAYDAAGNSSGQSASATATTMALAAVSSDEIIIDNDEYGTSSTGTWKVSGGANPYGSNSLWGSGSSTYSWKANLKNGTYDVYMWWTSYSDRATNAPVRIKHASGAETVAVNQQLNGGKWNYLGTFSFDANGTVEISGTGSTSVTVCADAVKFVRKTDIDITSPSVPEDLSATAVSTSQIKLSWQASTDNVGVSGYKVYRNGIEIGSTEVASYPDSGLSESTSYSYTVSAYDAAGNVSGQSASATTTTLTPPDTQAPTVPANLSATGVSISRIDLSWTASTDNVGVSGYKVYRNGIEIGTTADVAYFDTGLTESTFYTYAVAAFDAAGNVSGQSATASATTETKAVLTTLQLVSPNGGEVLASGSAFPVKWDSSENVLKFDLLYSADNGSNWTKIASGVSGNSYSWLVPVLKKNNPNCLVKVIGYDISGKQVMEDLSDRKFTIR